MVYTKREADFYNSQALKCMYMLNPLFYLFKVAITRL